MGRHDRQRRLAEVGEGGQRRIRASRVLVVGLGGLGCPAALHLAGAGVGRLGLMDFDRVEISNLHRQPLYATSDVGRPKVEAARDRLAALDPDVRLVLHPERLETGNAAARVAAYDVALSCTDDAAAQHALNDACVAAGVPLVHAAVSSWEGELLVVPPGGPCLRCLRPIPRAGPTCAEEGVLGPVPGVLGAMQAAEALKVLLGLPAPPGRLLLWDGRGASFDTVTFERNPRCGAHVDGPACPLPWNAPEVAEVSTDEYEARKEGVFLLDVREPDEFEEARIPGATLIPLGQLPQRAAEIPQGRPVVVYCAVGGRSARATEWLRAHGFDAVNLRGGIRSWLARYG